MPPRHFSSVRHQKLWIILLHTRTFKDYRPDNPFFSPEIIGSKLFVSRIRLFRLLNRIWKLFQTLSHSGPDPGKTGIAFRNPAAVCRNPCRAREEEDAASGGDMDRGSLSGSRPAAIARGLFSTSFTSRPTGSLNQVRHTSFPPGTTGFF